MDLEKIQKARQSQRLKAQKFASEVNLQRQSQSLLSTLKDNGSSVVDTLKRAAYAIVSSEQETRQSVDVGSANITSAINDVQAKVSELIQSLDQLKPIPDDDTNIVQAINELKAVAAGIPAAIKVPTPQNIKSISVDNQIDYSKHFSSLMTAIKGINVKPQVNVQVPKIDVPQVDVTPIVQTLNADKNDLSDYKAQDLEDGDGYQYVGFVNPKGDWYIIENDIASNSLRYVFGNTDYPTYWKNHVNLNYKFYYEAINEVQA